MGISKELTEEDIKFRYINEAITSKGWSKDSIFMEQKVKFTDGKISLHGNLVHREKPKYADYVLYANKATPIAIVEAKDANHSVSHGLQQAMTYAQMLDVKFAYSSNGEGFAEHDFLTGKERTFAMGEFPTKEELVERYKNEANDGNGLNEQELSVIEQPFCTGQNIFPPRYYQRNAVNRTVGAIAKGQNRVLLVMATGTGKTYTAFQIVWRLLKSGLKKKVLYLADRNILVDQSIQQDFKPLDKVTHKIDYSKDKNHLEELASYQVFFALYQQLIGQNDAKNYKELFPNPDYFDLVIVDECHRGSAKDDSNWRNILEYFSSATHIGMTATPKETKYQSSIGYFGEPIYTYSLKNGIEDGFLAPFKVINITTNIGDEWRPTKGQKDIYGNEIEDRIYNNSDYDYNIVIEDRIREVAQEITNYLKSTDRMAKTIVFCADETHAERMRMALANANADMCKKNPDYVVRITGSDEYGKGKLDYFISVAEKYPVIATTSKLLSTGVDCKMTKLIVLDQQIGSMTEFKQIIGRGTRLREKEGKTYFTVMDFRNVTRLFADPDWDGPIEIDPNYPPKPHICPVCGQNPCVCPKPTPEPCPVCGQIPCICQQPPKQPKPIVNSDGCTVKVINKVVSVYDTNGKLLRTESITDYTKKSIIDTYATIDTFTSKWKESKKKSDIAEMLKESGIDLAVLKHDQNMEDVDDFDFICHIAYGKKTLTRHERAEQVKKRDIFSKYGEQARLVLEALLDKYTKEGVSELESLTVLENDPFRKLGSKANIVKFFGGKQGYLDAVKELEQCIYNIA
ncbi:DEAD/DEAH box helicase family protein [Bacteroides thetaiotaomicron]|uniref:EcoAI/FtnUII family type I restriction enzme subunit R n=1 Tax=Bacteroides thetaiotaomicron TaxID=818 RepID=UPI0023314ADB|nr:DEAD/DEAH box helicase family protein [Bacteroides thetaiotaomicron]MDC2068374.1 DEAD/DEAH box helicase family protein [Bacteroides thetaiotaomicron]MDC2082663.1 DEAD/DEAH box helicase family protein [Bacteroides thetaiotaomicron]MDC2087357.1 DEAD/DEAH box helicase family protein [Bacteroides thetaiotaomicron]